MDQQNFESDEIEVWDPLLRIFHWSLVLAFAIAYFTEDELLALHVWSGYAMGGLILFRIVWGFIGPKHARFSDFVFGPIAVLSYLRDVLSFRAQRYVGHNPAGGVMVLLLLGFLAATTWSGLELHAAQNNAGPLAAMEGERVRGLNLISTAVADEDGREEKEEQKREDSEGVELTEDKKGEFWEELHEAFANVTLVLVFLHIAGVIVGSIAHGENLARAMVTGRKRRHLE